MESLVDKKFWNDKKVLITGHTGFKGSWLSIILNCLGANVSGYALRPISNPSFFNIIKKDLKINSYIGDVRNYENLKDKIETIQPEIIIHMAAQPLVRLSYEKPVETYGTNVLGLVNLLDICKTSNSLRAVLNITSDKCYENKEWLWGYRESDRLGGHDPYSNSKACAELVTSAFQKSFYNKLKIGLATARAGNVIGGGDWSIDRLIPDFIRAQQSKTSLQIRNPYAVRPWQHVIEPLVGYLMLCEKLYAKPDKYNEAWNFGPNDFGLVNVENVIIEMQKNSSKDVIVEFNRDDSKHEASLLKLDASKVKNHLNWSGRWNFQQTIKYTAEWYEHFYSKKNMYDISVAQFNQYIS